MRLIYVNMHMQVNYVNMQYLSVNMQDIYVNMSTVSLYRISLNFDLYMCQFPQYM